MVHLFDITINDNIISCNYTPETSDKAGYVAVDLNSGEVSNVKFSEYEYGKKMYVAHVRSKLMEIAKSSDAIPKKAVAVWY